MTTLAGGRFDDLVAGTALQFAPPRRVLAAHRPEQVAPVLQEVDEATRAGAWAFGFVAYEAASGLDDTLVTATPEPGLPLVWFGLGDPPAAVPPIRQAGGPVEGPRHRRWAADWSDAAHEAAVSCVREHIAAGQTYQCNLTDRLRTVDVAEPEALYSQLVLGQQAAYNALLDTGRHVVASASPELFFEWREDRLLTRPMKGTVARGLSSEEDRERVAALRRSAKERAENVMIVDLLRNDLAKVCASGSIDVPKLFTVERYPTVWQLTSEVTGRPRPGTTLVALFRALFPCGSVTGAPKARTMRLIRDLEASPRGVYCGAVGMVAPPGASFRARFNVAIRTAVVDRARGEAVYGAGGGITWSSDAAAERAEVVAKTLVLTRSNDRPDLLETLLHLPEQGARNLERHLARLADSAAYLGYPLDVEDARKVLAAAVRGRDRPSRVRICLHPSGQLRVELGEPPGPAAAPVTLAVDAEPVDSGSVWLRHKTTRREAFTTRAARHPGAEDVVLVNERGELTETTIANLAVHLDGRWWTPPTRCGCLPGVERGRLLQSGTLRERVLRVEDLAHADGLALVSSLRGWRPAVLPSS